MNIIGKIADKWQRNSRIYAEAWRQGRIVGIGYTLLLWKNHTKFLMRIRNAKDQQRAIYRMISFMEQFAYVVDKYKTAPSYPAPIDRTEEKTIWVYWNDERYMPSMVMSCIQRIRDNANGHKVIIITKDNVTDYLDFDPVVWRKWREGKITPTHFSDFVRAGLLLKYGGVYMDSTILLTQPLPAYVTESDYYTNHLPSVNHTNVSGGRWSSFFQACHKDCLLMQVVLEIFTEYWKRYDALADYVLIDYAMNLAYTHIPSVRLLIDSVPVNNPDIWIQQVNISKPFTREQFYALLSDKSRFLWKFSCKGSADAPVRTADGRVTLKGWICGEGDGL